MKKTSVDRVENQNIFCFLYIILHLEKWIASEFVRLVKERKLF